MTTSPSRFRTPRPRPPSARPGAWTRGGPPSGPAAPRSSGVRFDRKTKTWPVETSSPVCSTQPASASKPDRHHLEHRRRIVPSRDGARPAGATRAPVAVPPGRKRGLGDAARDGEGCLRPCPRTEGRDGLRALRGSVLATLGGDARPDHAFRGAVQAQLVSSKVAENGLPPIKWREPRRSSCVGFRGRHVWGWPRTREGGGARPSPRSSRAHRATNRTRRARSAGARICTKLLEAGAGPAGGPCPTVLPDHADIPLQDAPC